MDQLRDGILPASKVSGVILDQDTGPVEVCNSLCLGSSQQAFQESQLQHTEWPTSWNDELFAFLRDNPES